MYKALVGEDVCACVLDDVTAALDPQVGVLFSATTAGASLMFSGCWGVAV